MVKSRKYVRSDVMVHICGVYESTIIVIFEWCTNRNTNMEDFRFNEE
jgi:hypothetical protein